MNTPHSSPEDDPIPLTVSPQALIPANFTMDVQLDSDDHLEINGDEHNNNDLWRSDHSLSSMPSPADHPLVASSTAAEQGTTTTTTTTTVSTPLVVDIALAASSHAGSCSSPEYYSIQGEASETSSSSSATAAAAATLLPPSDGSRRTKGRWPPKRAYSLVGTMASCRFLKKRCMVLLICANKYLEII